MTQPKVAVKINGKFEAWSFSRWNAYEQCPYKAALTNIMRMKEPSNEAMDRGSRIHTSGERYVLKTVTKLDVDLAKFKAQFAALRKRANVLVEQQWAFTAAWQRTEWFGKAAWLRVMLDIHYLLTPADGKGDILNIVDIKTGKEKPEEHKMQLELYALAGLLMYPGVSVVNSELWYTDAGTKAQLIVTNTPEELERLKKLWLDRIKPMMNDKLFPPRPSNNCRWCHFRRSNSGPCVY